MCFETRVNFNHYKQRPPRLDQMLECVCKIIRLCHSPEGIPLRDGVRSEATKNLIFKRNFG